MQLTEQQTRQLAELHRTYGFLFLTNISLYHFHIVVLGFMISTYIVTIIILAGLVEVYRPLQRLKAFI